MRKSKIIGLTISFLSTLASAQSSEFDGWSAQIGLGYQSSDVTLDNVKQSGTAIAVTADKLKPSGTVMMLGVGYTASMTDKYTLGGMFEINALKSQSSFGNTYFNGAKVASGGITNVLANQYQLSIVGGYKMEKDTLLYGKLGYVTAKSETTNEDASAATSPNMSGYALGVGLKKLYDKKTFGYIEANSIKFNNQDLTDAGDSRITYTSGGSGYNIVVGIGMNF